MNKNFSKTLILVTMSLWGSHLIAGSVTVPNTFTGGTTASAAEVNANFDAVKSAVDDNDVRITGNAGDIAANAVNITDNTNAINALSSSMPNVYVDGVLVGKLADYPENNLFSTILITLPTGYLAWFDGSDGLYNASPGASEAHEIFYLSGNCSGQAYVKKESVMPVAVYGMGQLYANSGVDPNTIYYIPKNSTLESLTYNSRNNGFSCTAETAGATLIKTYLNDSNETGITDNDLIGTVSISY